MWRISLLLLVATILSGCQCLRHRSACVPCPKECEIIEECYPCPEPKEPKHQAENIIPTPIKIHRPKAQSLPPSSHAKPCPPPKPEVKFRQPKTIHVKLPPQKIVVESQQQCPPAPPHAMPQQMMMAPTQAAPMYQPQAAPGFFQNVTQGARLGLTFDFLRIPIPIPKLIAVPTAPAVPMMMAAQQPVIAAQQPVMAAPQPAMAAPQMARVPVQGQAVVPVQGQALVPVQGQAMVPVQGQAMVPAQSPQQVMVPVQRPMAVPQAQHRYAIVPQPQAPAQAPRQPTLEELEEFCRQVAEMRKKQQCNIKKQQCQK